MMRDVGSIPSYTAPLGTLRPAAAAAPKETAAALPGESASISSAARTAPADAPKAAPTAAGLSRLARATTLALAIGLAGAVSGCATMVPPLQQGQTRPEQVQQNPTVLNSVGSGAHKIADGFADFGKGIGNAARQGWSQISDGWKSANPAPQQPQQPQQPQKHAPKKN